MSDDPDTAPVVLVADDDEDFLAFLATRLSREPWDLRKASDGQEALDILLTKEIDVAVLDLKMPKLDALNILKSVSREGIQTDIIVVTGYATVESAVLAMRRGAHNFLKKPLKTEELLTIIRHLLDARYPSTRTLAQRLEAYVKDHAYDSGLRIDDLCNHFSISPRYVSKLFRENLGTSFKRIVAGHRVERAKQLIRTGDEPLYSVADKCGFRNYRQLTSTFKNVEGMLPRTYREVCEKT
jgi:YesN/AraC family two-component response regulator